MTILPNAINYWVINCISFSEKGSPNGSQRSDWSRFEHPSEVDD